MEWYIYLLPTGLLLLYLFILLLVYACLTCFRHICPSCHEKLMKTHTTNYQIKIEENEYTLMPFEELLANDDSSDMIKMLSDHTDIHTGTDRQTEAEAAGVEHFSLEHQHVAPQSTVHTSEIPEEISPPALAVLAPSDTMEMQPLYDDHIYDVAEDVQTCDHLPPIQPGVVTVSPNMLLSQKQALNKTSIGYQQRIIPVDGSAFSNETEAQDADICRESAHSPSDEKLISVNDSSSSDTHFISNDKRRTVIQLLTHSTHTSVSNEASSAAMPAAMTDLDSCYDMPEELISRTITDGSENEYDLAESTSTDRTQVHDVDKGKHCQPLTEEEPFYDEIPDRNSIEKVTTEYYAYGDIQDHMLTRDPMASPQTEDKEEFRLSGKILLSQKLSLRKVNPERRVQTSFTYGSTDSGQGKQEENTDLQERQYSNLDAANMSGCSSPETHFSSKRDNNMSTSVGTESYLTAVASREDEENYCAMREEQQLQLNEETTKPDTTKVVTLCENTLLARRKALRKVGLRTTAHTNLVYQSTDFSQLKGESNHMPVDNPYSVLDEDVPAVTNPWSSATPCPPGLQRHHGGNDNVWSKQSPNDVHYENTLPVNLYENFRLPKW